MTFRNLVGRYALALASPNSEDAIAKLATQLAQEMYGIEVTPEDVLDILEAANDLCDEDYKDVIDYAIEGIKDNL